VSVEVRLHLAARGQRICLGKEQALITNNRPSGVERRSKRCRRLPGAPGAVTGGKLTHNQEDG